jgi:nitrogen fixation/metabolism regulation signal transduction histidine kinase
MLTLTLVVLVVLVILLFIVSFIYKSIHHKRSKYIEGIIIAYLLLIILIILITRNIIKIWDKWHDDLDRKKLKVERTILTVSLSSNELKYFPIEPPKYKLFVVYIHY